MLPSGRRMAFPALAKAGMEPAAVTPPRGREVMDAETTNRPLGMSGGISVLGIQGIVRSGRPPLTERRWSGRVDAEGDRDDDRSALLRVCLVEAGAGAELRAPGAPRGLAKIIRSGVPGASAAPAPLLEAAGFESPLAGRYILEAWNSRVW